MSENGMLEMSKPETLRRQAKIGAQIRIVYGVQNMTKKVVHTLKCVKVTQAEKKRTSRDTKKEGDKLMIQTSQNLTCQVEALSAWEQELWQRYGRIIYPQTEEGHRVFTLQKQETNHARKSNNERRG